MEETPAFLTDARRDILNDEYDGADATRRSHKSKIRSRSRTALMELIEVARSDEIDNVGVFEPNELARLLNALMVPDDGLTPRSNFEGTDEEYRTEYLYQLHLHSRLRHELDAFDDLLHDEPDGDWFGELEELDTQ